MEKELAQYRRTLRGQTAFCCAGAALLLILVALSILEIITPAGGGRA